MAGHQKIFVTYSPTEGNFQSQHSADKPPEHAATPETFVLQIEEGAYLKMIHHEGESVPHEQYELFKMAPHGALRRPSQGEMKEVFGTSDELMVCYHMAREGKVREGFDEL